MNAPWTAAEDAALIHAATTGIGILDAGLGRGEAAIFLRFYALKARGVIPATARPGLRPRTSTTPRRCLACLEVFASTGPGNRICRVCKTTVDFASPITVHGVFA